MLTRTKRRILFWGLVLIFLALVPVVVLYSLGWRLDDAWNLKKTGGLYIAADISSSEIFINGELQRRTNLLQSGAFVDNLTPGKYQAAVLHKDYLPWTKELIVSSQLVAEARALLVPQTPNAKVLPTEEFAPIVALIQERETILERTDSRGSSKVVWDDENQRLKATWLRDLPFPYYFSAPEEILVSGKEIRNFEYYPKRRDAVITAFDNGIWTVEFDSRGRRIIQAIYKGKEPDFVLLPGESQLYILDDGILIQASLFAAE